MPLYSFALAMVLLLGTPVWLFRLVRLRTYRHGMRERLGDVPAYLTAGIRGRPVIWLHAVSVGEVLAATALVHELDVALPGYAVVISTTTPTGQKVARQRFSQERVFFFPLDFRFAVRRYLRALRPELLVLMESELWPRMLVECGRAGVPVVVANARISDRSLPRYLLLRVIWKRLLRHIERILAQSDQDSSRWIRIGMPADRVRSLGNLKFDTAAASGSALAALLRLSLPDNPRLLVAGSTHPGEEPVLLRCFINTRIPGRVLLLAPRQPHRAEAVTTQTMSMGLRVQRLSVWRENPEPIAEGDVLVLDSVGELASLYSLAACAYVGGSMVPHGGQNPLEPAQFGLPILIGESFENFREIVHALQDADAIFIVNTVTLCDRLRTCLDGSAPEVRRAAENARYFFRDQAGATQRTVAELMAVLRSGTQKADRL